MVALQVPDDANRTHVIRPAKVQDLLDDLVRCLVRMIVRTVLTTREPGFAELAVSISPEVERRSRNPEPSTCPIDVPPEN